ncbi:MAG: class I SAM-dependent methyltransferase [Oscillospiraceae bacterium]|nr:class I SAM-dependent methyltransferase [Oscillospiraceae bacterium]
MEVLKELNDYYSSYDEDSRLRSRHGSVEFITTMHYVRKYLRLGMRILEIGAATGRYSHELARQGYIVDAVELVPHNIEIFRRNTQPGEQVTITQGDARNLTGFGDNTYDITLLLGPMYHLFTVEDQLQALAEAIRVTKRGGVVFAAYCNNDATMVQYCFGRGMLREKRYQELVDMETFKASSDPAELFELYRKEDIDGLMGHFPVTRLHYLGSDMATNFMRAAVDEMEDELFELYLRYHLTICERPDMVGATHHILDIFRKD